MKCRSSGENQRNPRFIKIETQQATGFAANRLHHRTPQLWGCRSWDETYSWARFLNIRLASRAHTATEVSYEPRVTYKEEPGVVLIYMHSVAGGTPVC